MAGRSRSASEEQKTRPGRAERAACRRKEEKEDVYRSTGKEKSGSILRGAAATIRREDHSDCREARPKEERGARVVLQPEAETEAYEVRGAALTGGRRRGAALPGLRVRVLNARPPRPRIPTQLEQ